MTIKSGENSTAIVYTLLGEGEIELAEGLSSVIIEGTPLVDKTLAPTISSVGGTGRIDGSVITNLYGLFSEINNPDKQRFALIHKGGPKLLADVTIVEGANEVSTSEDFFTSNMLHTSGQDEALGLSCKIRVPGAGENGSEYVGKVVEIIDARNAVLDPEISTAVTDADIYYDHFTEVVGYQTSISYNDIDVESGSISTRISTDNNDRNVHTDLSIVNVNDSRVPFDKAIRQNTRNFYIHKEGVGDGYESTSYTRDNWNGTTFRFAGWFRNPSLNTDNLVKIGLHITDNGELAWRLIEAVPSATTEWTYVEGTYTIIEDCQTITPFIQNLGDGWCEHTGWVFEELTDEGDQSQAIMADIPTNQSKAAIVEVSAANTGFVTVNVPTYTNFNNVRFAYRSGTRNQPAIPQYGGFSNATYGIDISTEIRQHNDYENLNPSSIKDASQGQGTTIIHSSSGTNNFGLANANIIDEVNFVINAPVLYRIKPASSAESAVSVAFQVKLFYTSDGINWADTAVFGPTDEEIQQVGTNINYIDRKTPLRNAFNGGSGTIGSSSTSPIKAETDYQFTVNLEPFKPFSQFRLEIKRITAHEYTAGDYDYKNTTVLKTAQAVIRDKLTYPHSAIAALIFDSNEFQGRTPSTQFDAMRTNIMVPTNYITREENDGLTALYTRDATTGQDTGTYQRWDGTFRGDKEDFGPDSVNYLPTFTDNPIWGMRDMIVNNRFGLGDFIRKENLKDYSFYGLSRYCDELVPDGKGGLEPRFRASWYITTATDAYKVLKDMATTFIGMGYWLDGAFTLDSDRKKSPVYTFTKGNVIDGIFNYEGTSSKVRPNQIVVSWENPLNYYKQTPQIVEDIENIIQTGTIIKEDAVAFGCFSQGQANRYGKWKLLTARDRKDIVSFKSAENAAHLRPGDVINIQDADRAMVRYSGRISTGSTTTSVNLDKAVDLTGVKYKLHIVYPEGGAYLLQSTATINGVDYVYGQHILADVDGNAITSEEAANDQIDDEGNAVSVLWSGDCRVEVRDITNPSGIADILTVDTPFTDTPEHELIWALTEYDENGNVIAGSTKQYKILSISEKKSVYSFNAAEYVVGLYDEVDETFEVVTPRVTPRGNVSVPAPTNIVLASTPVNTDEAGVTIGASNVAISWKPPLQKNSEGLDELYPYITGYKIYHDIPEFVSPINILSNTTTYQFANVEPGEYTFRLQSKGTNGGTSTPIISKLKVVTQASTVVPKQAKLPVGGSLSSKFIIEDDVFTISSSDYSFTNTSGAVSTLTNVVEANRTIDPTNYNGTSMADGSTAYIVFDNDIGGLKLLTTFNEDSIQALVELGTTETSLIASDCVVNGSKVTKSGVDFKVLLADREGEYILIGSQWAKLNSILDDQTFTVDRILTDGITTVRATTFNPDFIEDNIIATIKRTGSKYDYTVHASVETSTLLTNIDARVVNLSVDNQVFVFDEDGNTPSPQDTTVTAEALNTTGTVFYEFLLNNTTVQNSISNTYTYTPKTSYNDMPEVLSVKIRENSNSSDVLASDLVSLIGIKPGLKGVNAINAVLSNEAHTLPTSNTGVVTYTSAGTDLSVFSGNSELPYAETGANTWSLSSVVGSNITVGSASTINGTIRRFSAPTNITEDVARIIFNIVIRGSDGLVVEGFQKIMSLSKAKQGADGIPGANGTDGTPGADGADGVSTYIHIAYANDSTGSLDFTTGNPGTRTYIGTLVDSNVADSDNPTDYTWSKYVGADGTDGTPGAPGADGVSTYIHIAYSNNSTGSLDFTTGAAGDRTYIGTLVDSTLADSTNPADYTWSKFVGANGVTAVLSNEAHTLYTNKNGIVDYTGAGTDLYVFAGSSELTFAPTGANTWTVTVVQEGITIGSETTINGTARRFSSLSNMTGDSARILFNIVVRDSQGVVSEGFQKIMSLTKVKEGADGIPGADGVDGTPGADGADGVSTYIHIAYANNSTGSLDFTTGSPGTRTYIGTLVDSNVADSTNPADYTWSKYVGADGTDGTPGAPGADGVSTYIHIAYSNNSTGSLDFTTGAAGDRTYIGTLVDNNVADSTNPSDYTWSKFVGEDGADGADGATGADGVRGSKEFYTTTTGSAWSDSIADQAIVSEGLSKVILDNVTMTNVANGFAEKRFWSGTEWTLITQVIPGNILFPGSVGINELAAGSINASTISSDFGTMESHIRVGKQGSITDASFLAGESYSPDYRFWVGNVSPLSSKFSIDKDGKVIARDLQIEDSQGNIIFNVTEGFSDFAKNLILINSASFVNPLVVSLDENTDTQSFTLFETTEVTYKVKIPRLSRTLTYTFGQTAPAMSGPNSITLSIQRKSSSTTFTEIDSITLLKDTHYSYTLVDSKAPTGTVQEPDIPGYVTYEFKGIGDFADSNGSLTYPESGSVDFRESIDPGAISEDYTVRSVIGSATFNGVNLATRSRTLIIEDINPIKGFSVTSAGASVGDLTNADTLNTFPSSYFLSRNNHTGTLPNNAISLESVLQYEEVILNNSNLTGQPTAPTPLENDNSTRIATTEFVVGKIDSITLSGADIKLAYEAEADTNAFTDDEKSKLSGIEANATADQTGSEIKIAYEAEADTNAFTDDEKSKLSGIEGGAQVNTVTGVAGRTGDITLDKNDVGLDNIDNTSDLDKPVSIATENSIKEAKTNVFNSLGTRETIGPNMGLMPAYAMNDSKGVFVLNKGNLVQLDNSQAPIIISSNLEGGIVINFNGVVDSVLRPDGSFTQTTFENGAVFNSANVSHAIPSIHLVKDLPQLAIQMPWRDANSRAPVFKVIWSGQGIGAPQNIVKVIEDVYAFQSLEGVPSTIFIPKNKVLTKANTDAIIGYCETGQSLSTNRVGSSPTNAWNIGVEWGVSISEQLLSFNVIAGPGNSTPGSDQAAETMSTQEFQLAVDAQVGNTVNGNILRSSSPTLNAGLVLAHGTTSPNDGRKVFIAELGNGGKPIEHFRQGYTGTDAGHFAGVYVPCLERFKDRADNASYDILAWIQPWVQGENDHVQDDTKAVYRAELDGYLDIDCETEIDRVLGSSVTRLFIGYQMGRIYESNTSPYPAGADAYEISQITLAIVEKGLSDDASDANFILSPPNYALTFSEISHMDERGYMHLKAMIAHTANAGLAAKEVGLKWKPLHFDPNKIYLTEGNTRLVMPAEIPFGACSNLRLGALEGTDRFTGVPQKTNHGLHFRGGSVPVVKDIYLNESQTAVIVDFETAWTGTSREVGVAFKAEDTSTFRGYQQGWNTSNNTPTGEWIHEGVGSNISVDMGWIEPSTGAAIRCYASHQLISLPD